MHFLICCYVLFLNKESAQWMCIVSRTFVAVFFRMLRDAKVTYQSTIVSSHSEDPRIHWGSQMTQQVLAITDVLGQDTFTVTFDDGMPCIPCTLRGAV